MNIPHIPVLLNEVLDIFKFEDNGYFIDCTLGFGGHSQAILEKYKNIKLIGIDQDLDAINFAKERLSSYSDRVEFINKKASEALLDLKGLDLKGILADIGVSSYQLDNRDRGFAFDSDILDMRMNQSSNFSADNVVNFYSIGDLERVIKNYAEDRKYKKIARAIVSNRPIYSNKQLTELLMKVGIKSKKDLARIFQAIRIEVNSELIELESILNYSKEIAVSGTILAIITFHSLEDRIVKRYFKEWEKSCICSENAIRCECGNNHSLGKILTKKPIQASDKEIQLNPRSRSAKLRGFQFI